MPPPRRPMVHPAPDPDGGSARPRPGRPGWLSPGILAVLVGVYIACMRWVPRVDGAEIVWLDLWFHNGLLALAGLVTVRGASRSAFDRTGWLLAGGAILANATANTTWVLLFGSSALSPADALFLSFYPLMYAAVVVLARRRAVNRGLGQWLDGAVAGLGVAALVAAFAFPSLLTGGGGSSPLAIAVNVSYPVADLLLVVVLLAGLAPVGWRPDRALSLLIAGLLVNTVADVGYLLQAANDTYAANSWVNVAWVVALLGIASGSHASRRRPEEGGPTTTSGLLLPAASAIAALVLLVVATGHPVLGVAVALATATLMAAGIRVRLAFVELRSLALSRVEARTDELTKLPNRRAFLELVEESLGEVAETGSFALLLVDLDGFKEVNDTLGHQAGDALLTALARVLRDQLDPADHVARLGGDEFAIILRGVDLAGATQAAVTVRDALSAPVQLDGMAIAVGASIGISAAPEQATDTPTLMRYADMAMYRAKHSQSGIEAYETTTDTTNLERLELAQDVRAALPAGQIVLHYQPKVDVEHGRVTGTEALARWMHPERGLLFPDVFLPLIEQGGMVRDLTRAVLREAVSQLTDWGGRGIGWTVAVNIAPADLLDESLPAFVADLLRTHGVPASQLVLEITEGSLVGDPARASRTVRRLRQAGIQISLDDFGVGFSSLVHLRTLQFDELKLDRALAEHLEEDPRGRAIVQAAVGLADALGLRLVVEGIETASGRDALVELGVRYIQGYLYSRPLPPDALETWAAASPLLTPASPVGGSGAGGAVPVVDPQAGLVGP